MDFNNVLHSTKCTCGVQITNKHLKTPFIKVPMPKHYYGGRVKKMLKAVCDCGREYVALLNAGHNSYSIIDLIPLQEEKAEEAPKVDESAKTLDPEQRIDLDSLKRQELMKLAKELGIEKTNLMKNVDLIKAIKEI